MIKLKNPTGEGKDNFPVKIILTISAINVAIFRSRISLRSIGINTER